MEFKPTQTILISQKSKTFDQNNLKFNISYIKNNTINEKIFYMETIEAGVETMKIFDELNLAQRNGDSRNFKVLVNPVSGSQDSFKIFDEVFAPMCNIADLQCEMIETLDKDFICNWVKSLTKEDIDFTDIIFIGGDGMFHQYLNAIVNHPLRHILINIPVGFLPGGTTNSNACALSCSDPYKASLLILRGETIKGDIMKLQFDAQQKIVFGTAMTWGISSDIVKDSERVRTCCRKRRYVCCGFK